MNKWYENIGQKIMIIAWILAGIIFISEICTGIILLGEDDGIQWTFMCIGIILASPITAYLSTILLFGFGKLIDSAEKIEKILYASDDYISDYDCKNDESVEDLTPEVQDEEGFKVKKNEPIVEVILALLFLGIVFLLIMFVI